MYLLWLVIGASWASGPPTAEPAITPAIAQDLLREDRILLYDLIQDGKTSLVRIEVGDCEADACDLRIQEAADASAMLLAPAKDKRMTVDQLQERLTFTPSLPTEVKHVTVPMGGFMVRRYSEITHGGRHLEQWDFHLKHPGAPLRYLRTVDGEERIRLELRTHTMSMSGIRVDSGPVKGRSIEKPRRDPQ